MSNYRYSTAGRNVQGERAKKPGGESARHRGESARGWTSQGANQTDTGGKPAKGWKSQTLSYQLYNSQQSSAWSSDDTCVCNGCSCTQWVQVGYLLTEACRIQPEYKMRKMNYNQHILITCIHTENTSLKKYRNKSNSLHHIDDW